MTHHTVGVTIIAQKIMVDAKGERNSVESPTAGDTLYRYTVKATKDNDLVSIALPDYFVHLNKDVQIFVTPQGHFGNGYGELNIFEEQLEIHCASKGEYNVLVIGTRNDDHQSIKDWNSELPPLIEVWAS